MVYFPPKTGKLTKTKKKMTGLILATTLDILTLVFSCQDDEVMLDERSGTSAYIAMSHGWGEKRSISSYGRSGFPNSLPFLLVHLLNSSTLRRHCKSG